MPAIDQQVIDYLRLARRPLTHAELAALRFGPAPNDAQRKQIGTAVRRLELERRVVTSTGPAANSRGQTRLQNLVALAVDEPQPAAPVADDITAAAMTPDAPVICDKHGDWLAVDMRAVHQYAREVDWKSPALIESAAECDDQCRAACIDPPAARLRPEVAAWLRTHPRPVVVLRGGQMYEVLPGRTVTEVVAAAAE